MPAVSICTDAFAVPAAAMAKAYGLPGYEFVTVTHPVASLDDDGIRERVSMVLPDILRILGVAEEMVR
ncbi:MAG TPA: hypothetical protein VNP20_10190 [Nocardioidaceae bacterium]|nr:hypothetical protein [Nocardioidaceae bacterium]